MSYFNWDESEEAYFERLAEEQSFPTSASEWDRADASARGARHPEQAWVLSDRDVWHRNPYYQGPPVPHPEDYDPEDLA
jgi:hypothetical protein